MSDADEQSAGDLLWQLAREKYEDPAIDLKLVAESLGIHRARLIGEARRRGWKLRTVTKSSGTRATIQRFKELLQKRLAALYEQGRVSHVGAFAELEDEMCSAIGEGKKSPDRLDALVWAVSDLMLRRRAEPRIRIL